MAGLVEEEKERCRYHLGYQETAYAASVQFGLPRPVQTMFILESAMNYLQNPYAIQRVRRVLDTLDGLECQIAASTKTLVASQLGNLKLHPLAAQGKLVTDSLEREYSRWAKRLADIFGVPLYPYSARFQRSGPGTSIPVS